MPGGGKDEKLFAKDIVALSQLRLLEMLSMTGEQCCLFAATINAIGSFCVTAALKA